MKIRVPFRALCNKYILLIVGACLLSAFLFASISMSLASPVSERNLKSLLNFLKNLPNEKFGLLIRDTKSGSLIQRSQDLAFPLASVKKLIILDTVLSYIDQHKLAADQELSIERLDSYYWPNTDGDAHPESMAWAQKQHLINDRKKTISLKTALKMMIDFSSNAATDLILETIDSEDYGFRAIHQNISSSSSNLMPVLPIVGSIIANCPELGGFSKTELAALAPKDMAFHPRYAQRTHQLSKRFANNAMYKQLVLASDCDINEASYYDQFDTKATPTAIAHLMEGFATGSRMSIEATRIASETLEGFQLPHIDRVGYKGGRLPGIYNNAFYFFTNGTLSTATLFLRDLSESQINYLSQESALQKFIYLLATDSELRQQAAAELQTEQSP